MFKFILRRTVAGVLLIWVVATITFALLSITDTSVARNIVGPTASAAQETAKIAELGLDRSFPERYGEWLSHAITGDFGRSWFTGNNVGTSIANTMPVTLSVVVVGLGVSALMSLAIGSLAATRRGALDRWVQTGSVISAAFPGFLVALALVMAFAIQLRILPATGFVPFSESPVGWVRSIILPSLALAFGATAATTQQVRGSLIQILGLDYVRTLRSRGLKGRRLIYKHALRNAAPAALTVLSLQFISLVGGAVIIEKVFGLAGIGSLANSAASQGDLPVVLGVVVVMVIIVVVINLFMDLAQGWVNPKVRIK
ncbi:ABC transporter permease [Arthrobacter sp. MMS18-M83]|uniref:ABC transporter permease n=1 Tax=Arthrobacter sp. MMS18-M83 TaxID=2996261 RepID=UPI00227CCE15|nr:ABC transporter permease [Arthrobacter sp. MMS18-M83]WAH97295.1 ABC transporter permease [Arthrobacter sp. MMS18-M83]